MLTMGYPKSKESENDTHHQPPQIINGTASGTYVCTMTAIHSCLYRQFLVESQKGRHAFRPSDVFDYRVLDILD
jgi:hypothetical protein